MAGEPKFSISEVTTLGASFEDDLRTYRAAGADGIGIWELKLPAGGEEAALEQLEASGLVSTNAVPTIPSILPLPLMEGPEEPAARVDAICTSLERLAPFRPTAVACLTGPAGEREPDDARAVVVDGLRTIAAEAARLGLRVGLEPINAFQGEYWTTISSVPEAVELLEDAGSPPALGILFDVWHVWNTATVLDDIEREIGRFVGVHVSDWREPTRGWADRVLAGDGVAGVPSILRALEDAGWDGFYDLEIFSDNGAFGSSYPDSLWDVAPAELAARGRERFLEAWSERSETGPDRG